MTTNQGFEISGIPTIIVDPHHYVFPYWHQHVKDGILFHVDAHSDTCDWNIPTKLTKDYVKKLVIDTFICPAFHHGIISEMYWINPHQKGNPEYIKGNKAISTEPFIRKSTYEKANWLKKKYYSTFPPNIKWTNNKDESTIFCPLKKMDNLENVNFDQKPVILDIDLDAFATREIGQGYITDGWERKIDETMQLINTLHIKPKLITIAKSETPTRYTPEHLVEPILIKVLDGLESLLN